MPTPTVSLSDVLQAVGGPLEERALWALLHQAISALREEMKGERIRTQSRNFKIILLFPFALCCRSGARSRSKLADYSRVLATPFWR